MPWRAATVTTTQSQIAGYNPKRRSLSIENNGNANIFVSQDPTAVDTLGFPVAPGASLTLVREEGDQPEATVYAVASSGSQNVRIQEGVGE